MAIVNVKYQFIMIDVGAQKNTIFSQKFSQNQVNIPDPSTIKLPSTNKKYPYVFVGEAFQLLPNSMKPYNRAVLTDEKHIFNHRLSRTRRIVENVFRILTSRFKIFQQVIKFEPRKVRTILLSSTQLLV